MLYRFYVWSKSKNGWHQVRGDLNLSDAVYWLGKLRDLGYKVRWEAFECQV